MIKSVGTNSNPIAVYDSGVGGLSVLSSIRQQLPFEQFIYIADSAYVPYGTKDRHVITQRVNQIAEFAIEQQVKCLVIACNTATAIAVDQLRKSYPIPVIAMEPAVKPATEQSLSGKIGILATTNTVFSDRLASLINRYAVNAEVVTQACPGLVELIEGGNLEADSVRAMLTNYVKPMMAAGVDTIILGCTHYHFLVPMLKTMLGEGVSVLETGSAVARRVESRLTELQLRNGSQKMGDGVAYTTGELLVFEQKVKALLREKLRCEKAHI